MQAMHRLWCKIYDVCSHKRTRWFVLTNYCGWVFGTFSEGECARPSQLLPAPFSCQSRDDTSLGISHCQLGLQESHSPGSTLLLARVRDKLESEDRHPWCMGDSTGQCRDRRQHSPIPFELSFGLPHARRAAGPSRSAGTRFLALKKATGVSDASVEGDSHLSSVM